jgi:protein-S-isoprenylcysteine O-methyltransferase Ste14
MKNYVKEGQKLPMFGIGPKLIMTIGLLVVISIVLFVYVLKIGTVEGPAAWIFRAVGIVFFVLGFIIWFIGALKSGMDESISDNKLNTSGIYAWVRNPMYSGWWILITGISLMWHNVFLIPVFFINWLIMTIVLINTEEKWLLDLYGSEYAEYKKHVNRLIPWKR